MSNNQNPYVVSGDIDLLLRRWAIKKKFVLPPDSFFCDLRDDFCDAFKEVFPAFELVSATELKSGISYLVRESGLIPISLDQAYFHSKLRFDAARTVDAIGRDCGLANRPGTPSLKRQLKSLARVGSSEVVLVDDVLFTGSFIEQVISDFLKSGIKILLICVGIGIAEGICRINRLGYEIHYVYLYENVIDEICERDFYPGVPLAGRVLVGQQNVGVPYMLPWGNPGEWASIPDEYVVPLSKFCLSQTIKLFKEIEKSSNKIVTCADLDRGVLGMPQDDTQFTNFLTRQLMDLY